MEPHRPRGDRGRRPHARRRPPARRRVATERPINARTVRGTWLLVALPLLLAAFTVGRPEILPPPTLPPAFDGETAAALAGEVARLYPDRSPGTAGALGAADWFERQMALYGFEIQRERFEAPIPGRGRVELQNLVAVAEGASPNTIVFLAHRDNTGYAAGANDNASGTAALIELARAYAPVAGAGGVQARPAHRLVFVSTDGGAYGALGAARFAASSPYADDAVAAISLDAIAGTRAPRLLLGGDTARSPSPTLVRTAAARVLEATGAEPHRASALRQLLDLGFPYALGEQGPLVSRGVPAVTLTTAGVDARADAEAEPLTPARLDELGRAVQGLLGSLDAGVEIADGPTTYVYLGRRIVQGWALQLVLVAALFPFAVGVVDLFARCRRRRIGLLSALRNIRVRLLFWSFAALLLLVGAQLGLFAEVAPGRPFPPDAVGAGDPPLLGIAALAVVAFVAWVTVRERLLPRRAATSEETLAGYTAVLLLLGLVALLVVATNPFGLLYLLPSLYAWLWLPQVHDRSGFARGSLFAAGFAGPLLLLASFAEPHGLGWDAPWYLLSLVANGYAPWITAVLAVAWLAAAAQLAALVAARYGADTRGTARRTLGDRIGRASGLRGGRAARPEEDAREA